MLRVLGGGPRLSEAGLSNNQLPLKAPSQPLQRNKAAEPMQDLNPNPLLDPHDTHLELQGPRKTTVFHMFSTG
jgi:hypothetical protein